jgi:hypothetical protein
MKLINLNKGFTAQVDDEDYEHINQFNWYVAYSGNVMYARREVRIDGKQKHEWMHRTIIDTPANMETDHIDHNGLNNQKSNLRVSTRAQNCMNRKTWGRSKYVGVSYNRGFIQAQININGDRINLGRFKTEELAAKKYDEMAKIHYGEFANLNFPS